jgi:HEAT repeat protein
LSADPGVRAAALWRASIDKTLAAAERPALEKALGDESSEVRGLAAVALRLLGPEAAPSAPVLARLLSDPDTGVRMTAASALAAMGPRALPALPALLKACDATGEHVHVQRSLADALGAIGPPARDAVPALRRFREIPRVRWNAEAAIAHIESGSAR